jgi:hypothetical protein
MRPRDRMLLAVVAVVLLVGVGWFLVLSPQREEATQLSQQIEAQEQALAQAQGEVAAGLAAKRSYARTYTTVARLGAAVPDDDNVASLLLQVEEAAEATGIDFRELAVGASSGAAAAPPPPPTVDPAAATQTITATLPPGAAVGPAGFPTMPFNFTFTGDFFRMAGFIGRLERFLVVRNDDLAVSGRFMTIDGIALNAAPDGFPRIQADVTATTYLLPAAEGLTAGATPSGPAPASAGGTPTGPMGIASGTATPVAR